MDHTRHDYLSEACYHAKHTSCGTAASGEAGACRFCGAACRCSCHLVSTELLSRDNFISVITGARKARKWSQTWVARLVGVTQQAVSGWENGAPPPSGETLQKLCAVLGLTPDLDREFTAPLQLPTLPFHDLEPAQFTAFALDLVKAAFPDAAADTTEQRPEIDLYLQTDSGERIGVRCFQPRRFHPSSFDKARSETRDGSGLDRCLILLRTTTTPRVQEHAAAHPQWEIWDSKTLADQLRALDTEVAMQLIERYFPGRGASFLGAQP